VALPPAREVTLGRVLGVDPDGSPLVDSLGNGTGAPLCAAATSSYDASAVGREVALVFLNGDLLRPLALGLIRPAAEADMPQPGAEHLVISAEGDTTLRCGRASITLTRAGKVLIRGAYLSLRSSGMQRITGASVQIN
jgi:hypothetical protein